MASHAPGVVWRTVFTLASFFCFGLGALILGSVVLPLIHLTHRNSDQARRSSRRVVRASFRLFIWFMSSTGVLNYTITGSSRLPGRTLVVANHPSLIDVIFVIATLPDALCVVKGDIGRNFFTRLVVRATGYPTRVEPDALINECVRLLDAGHVVVMFPEGTRTLPGAAPLFKRGAATVLCRCLCPVTPVFLKIHPPTLAKGESWFKVPATQVQYSMEIGDSIEAAALLGPAVEERQQARICTERLQQLFLAKLSDNDRTSPGAD